MNQYQKVGFILALGFSAVANSSPVVLYNNLGIGIAAEQGIPPGWIADAFTTGTNAAGYNLGDITLKLTGGIDGIIQGIVLKLFDTTGAFPVNPDPDVPAFPLGAPGAAIGHAFVNPLKVGSTAQDSVFTPNVLDANLVLAPNTTYWARIDAFTPGATNINWSYAISGTGLWAYNTLGGDESSAQQGFLGPFLMKVQANAILGDIKAPSSIPVPAATWLMGSGLLGLVATWRRKKTA